MRLAGKKEYRIAMRSRNEDWVSKRMGVKERESQG